MQFPFEPYEIQKDYMRLVIDSIVNCKNAMLESPTGTGTVDAFAAVLRAGRNGLQIGMWNSFSFERTERLRSKAVCAIPGERPIGERTEQEEQGIRGVCVRPFDESEFKVAFFVNA